MARKQIDVSRFLEATPEEQPETPAQRQSRIAAARQNVDAMKGAIMENRRENDRLVRNHRKAKNDLYLDMRDLMAGIGYVPSASDALLPEDRMGMAMPPQHQFLTEQFPTNHDDVIMEEMYNQPRPQRPQRPMINEQMPPRPAQRNAPKLDLTSQSDNWTTKKFLGETRGGDTVSVWKVQNKKTGSGLDKLFRVESVANRIAMMLNESGNLNDPRVVGLIGAYDRRDKLLKEARGLEKSADGKQMKTERLRALRAEINQLEYRLGF